MCCTQAFDSNSRLTLSLNPSPARFSNENHHLCFLESWKTLNYPPVSSLLGQHVSHPPPGNGHGRIKSVSTSGPSPWLPATSAVQHVLERESVCAYSLLANMLFNNFKFDYIYIKIFQKIIFI